MDDFIDMTPPPAHRLTPAWRAALPSLAVVLAAALFLYRETALAMVAIWERSDTFAHAFLVPPIVLWLLWRERDRLTAIAPRPNAWALLPIAAVALVWLLGELAAVNSVTQFAFTALLVLAVPAVMGARVARAAMFPLAFLFFAVPLGEFLLPQLMEWTADFTVAALRLSGIPVYREGLQFVIPSGSWSVVEACSGVRYLIASFMVGTLFAYLTYRSLRRRLIFMAISIVVPVVANWFRAYMIVMLGHLSGNQLAVGVDHVIYGWLFFGIVILTLYAIGARWREAPPGVAGPAPPASAGAGMMVMPTVVATAAVILMAMPPLAQRAIAKAEGADAPALVMPATLAAGWHATAANLTDSSPRVDNPSAESRAVYALAGREVGLYVAYFRQQDHQRKLADIDGVVVESRDKQWRRVSVGSRELVVDGEPVGLRTAELRSSADSTQLVQDELTTWHLYWVNGSFTTSAYRAKAYLALYRLLGRGDDAAMVVFYVPRAAEGDGEAALAAFVQANLGAVDAWLRRVARRG